MIKLLKQHQLTAFRDLPWRAMLACVSGHTITRLVLDAASLGRVSGYFRRSGTHQTHWAGRKNEISCLAVHSDLASLLLREGVVKARSIIDGDRDTGMDI